MPSHGRFFCEISKVQTCMWLARTFLNSTNHQLWGLMFMLSVSTLRPALSTRASSNEVFSQIAPPSFWHIMLGNYCWWKNSSTTQHAWNLVNNGIFTIWTGYQLVQDFFHQPYYSLLFNYYSIPRLFKPWNIYHPNWRTLSQPLISGHVNSPSQKVTVKVPGWVVFLDLF